jgi:ergothioneine biosynthesis protein EgtB
MPDVSPTRWHLAHTTWFFETFILAAQKNYKPRHTEYRHLFNSYYNAIGKQFPRERRGLLSRPTVAQVMQYRREIDEEMAHLLAGDNFDPHTDLAALVELGLNHEQQHQELMLTDIKHVLSCNPLFPTYRSGKFLPDEPPATGWTEFDEGLFEIGHAGRNFAYDNESPRHRVFLESFRISNSLVTCGEYLKFIDDDGYQRPELWLSEGWKQVGAQGWQAPLYWHKIEGQWHEFTLAGLRPLNHRQPVCHLSFFEADAFARWADARLPTEAEWEFASQLVPIAGNWADTSIASGVAVHPQTTPPENSQPAQMFGAVWQWTASPYIAYPGYRPAEGAVGEYNGKFMCNQYVLRGASCATPANHVRRTYRNFFPADARWQFTGLRLAQ